MLASLKRITIITQENDIIEILLRRQNPMSADRETNLFDICEVCLKTIIIVEKDPICYASVKSNCFALTK